MTAIPARRLSDDDLEALLSFFQGTGTCLRDEERPSNTN